MRRAALLALAVLLAAPARGAAQAGSCELVESRMLHYQDVGGLANINVGGPLRVVCKGGETLRADSAVLYQAANQVHLFGRVDFRDPTRTLTSDYATYSSVTGRLFATGNVVYTDRTRGSTLRGPELEYFRAMEGRPQAQVIAGQRPHLTVVPTDAKEGNREPLEIDADRITGVGEHYFSASGRVEIRRSDLDADAEEAMHDARAETLQLRGNARIRGERFDLAGETVDATMPGGDLDQVTAKREASLVSEKLRVDGPEIRLFFTDDLLQRLVTHGAAEGEERPLVTAKGFRMEADSLEALLPGQELERVIAIGKARGETVDTTGQAAAPDTADRRARIARGERPASGTLVRDRDWVVGDTLIGYFVPADSAARAASDSPEGEVELDRVLAKGSARSLYRVREEGEEAPRAERPALNYLAGEEIELMLRGGELDVAHVRGLQRGVYLDPRPLVAGTPAPTGGKTPEEGPREPPQGASAPPTP